MKKAAIAFVLLASCTKDQQQQTVTPAAPDAAIVLAAVKTASVAEEPDEPDEPDDPDDLEPEEPEPAAGACAAKVPWSALPRCTREGFVYAVGSSVGVRDLSLARAKAAFEARGKLAKGNLAGAEVLELGRCGKTMFALARAPAKNVPAEKTACAAAALEAHAAPMPGCPAWTVNGVRREGDTVVAVGVARVKNPALAESAAINRARAELTRASVVHVSKDGHGHSASGEAGFSELGRKKAACAGNTFIELTAKAIE